MIRLCNVLYHANCLDGFASMVVAKFLLQREGKVVNCQAVSYEKPIPEMEPDSDVYIVDFSYSPEVIKSVADRYYKMVILDHHDTAMREWEKEHAIAKNYKVFPHFRNDLSGVGMVWNYFSSGADPLPQLLKHVQDRDLWRFEMPYTKEINSALFSYGWTPKLEKLLLEWTVPAQEGIDYQNLLCFDLYKEGEGILRAHEQYQEATIAATRFVSICGAAIPVVNCAPFLSSEVLNKLCLLHKSPMAIGYIDKADWTRYLQFRSTPGGWHVGKLAKVLYGGGGHAHASGATVPLDICRSYTGLPALREGINQHEAIEYTPLKETNDANAS